ncbi:sensors of blue-light using FAD family protein [Asticcacaulis biprosthecium C19]|uniref:Sensors of blue-light using FAD family protein n=2 Tax=Asticcacaulis biprosthecium TaxID=76891 RepID=F4QHK8_9CAUL|nr:sensors of blue-light using FAD family protein [Asticcacaulis biprosthecium C19]
MLQGVLEPSRERNMAEGITGMLCYTDDVFLQILEGGRTEVSQLLTRIMRDDRHSDVTLLVFDEIDERAFSDWSMGQASLDKVNPGHLLRFSPRRQIDPFNGPGHVMLAMLLDLRAHGGIVSR